MLFAQRNKQKYENEIEVLETCDRVARLSIFIAHQTGLINTFVTNCYLMVHGKNQYPASEKNEKHP